MNNASVRKWFIVFEGRRPNVLGEKRSGWPSVVTDELGGKTEEEIHKDRRFTLEGLYTLFNEI